jgi:hypothetical protein
MTPRIFRTLALSAVLVPALAAPASALRVMTYNLLNYSSGRTAQFQLILDQTQPDVLVAEEVISVGGANAFLNTVLNVVDPGEWTLGPFVDGPDTDNAFYYRSAAASFVAHHVIATSLRNIDEYTFRPATHASPGANVRIYVVHLKASQGSSNETQRLGEVTSMRSRMETFPVGQSYMVAGDFNIYANTESAYQYMTSASNGLAGVVEDPIQREGNWHVNVSFADVHTQSPRVTQFGGGANGGMDDRFDLILTSPALTDGEGLDALPATYTAYGQDGMHFDGALNVPPYVVVDSTTAQALHDASDHLPVFVDLQGYALLIADASVDLGAAIVGGVATADLSVGNGAAVPGDDLDYSLSAPPEFSAPGGGFSVAAGAPAAIHAVGMDTGSAGARAGDLVIASDDPDAPSRLVPLTGTVLDHAVASVEAGSALTAASLDLGVIAAGDTAVAAAEAHNFGYGALQALLDVHSFSLAGDPRFFLDAFSPAAVGAAPAPFDVAFDGAGAAPAVYNGTLTLHTRDQQDLSGAAAQADLVYDLTVEVASQPVGAAIAAGLPDRSGFVSVHPNPFRPSATLRFATVAAGSVTLRIYDVRGSLVRTLQSAPLGPGFHERDWNGRDETGRAVAPGIYFARLVTGESVEIRKLVRIR